MPSRPDPIAFLTGQLRQSPYPSGIGLPGTGAKFTTDGTVEIWPGNTFVCHVTRPSKSYAALVEMQERVKMSRFGPLFTWLPAPSFHMTLFQGMSPGKQGSADWPEGVRADAPRDAVTAEILRRTEGVDLPRFDIRATDLFCGKSLTVVGRDAAAEAALRVARVRLREATGIRPPDFDSYVFHITLGYLIQWVSPGTAAELVAFSAETYGMFAGALQDITLDPCGVCNFDSMHHFEVLRAFGSPESVEQPRTAAEKAASHS